MKKSIKYIAMTCAAMLTAAFVGCEDPHTVNLEDYQTLVYFRDGGEQILTITRVDAQTVCRIPVCKSGRDVTAETSAEVLVMEQRQLDIYNMQNGTRYVIAPEECFEITKNREMTFTSDDSYKVVELVVDTDALFAEQERLNAEGKVMVVAIQLYSPSSMTKGLNYVIFTPELEYAYLTFGDQQAEAEYTCDMPAWNNIDASVRLNVANEWGMTCEVSLAENADEIVEQINAQYGDEKQGRVYSLLPADRYELPESIELPVGSSNENFKIRVNRYFAESESGEVDEYTPPFFVLPLELKNLSKEGIELNEMSRMTVLLSHEMKFVGLEPVKLTADSFTSDYTYENTLGELIDDNPDTFWGSVYNGKAGDETYGYYIDIKLPSPARYFMFTYCTRANNNAVPYRVTIGASVDGKTWEVIEENIPCTATGQKEYATMPVVGKSDGGPYGYVRFGFAQTFGSGGGDLKGSAPDGTQRSAALSELSLEAGLTEPMFMALYDPE